MEFLDQLEPAAFLLRLLLVLLAAWIGGRMAERIGYPAMLGELLVGMILGPPLLGVLTHHVGLHFLAEFGIFIMMLYIGTEIDPQELLKASRNAMLAAVGGFVVPFVGGLAVTWWYMNNNGAETKDAVMAGMFVGMAVGVTSLAAKSRILLDLKLLDTRIALVLMAGALFADSAALVVFAGITGFADAGSVSLGQLAIVAGKAVLFFVICVGLGHFLLPAIMRIPERLGAGMLGKLTIILLVALGFGEIAHVLGLHAILGSFLAGLFMRGAMPDRREQRELTHRIHDMAIGLFAPVFFVTAGFAFDFDVFTRAPGLLVAVVGVAIVGKIVGTVLFYLPSGHGWREGVTIGFGMNGRGAVEIIIAGIALQKGLISADIFSILVFMAIFTTAMVPVTLKWCVAWLEKHGELVRLSHRKGYLIMGAGPLARLAGKLLSADNPVRLIDRNADHCRIAREEGLEVREGNALDEGLLDDAGVLHVQGFLALTSNSELNVMGARLAADQFLVPDTSVALAVGKAGDIESLLSREQVSVLFHVGLDMAEWDRCVARDQHETEVIEIRDEAHAQQVLEGTKSSLHLPLIVNRGGSSRPARADEVFEAGDIVTVLREQAKTTTVEVDHFDKLAAGSTIIDLDDPMDLEDFLKTIAPLLASEMDENEADIIKAYHTRELTSGTVLGQGVAIPHIMLEGEGRTHLLVVRARGGVKFIDVEEPVHILFVMASSKDQRNVHLRCLSAIAQIVQSSKFETAWFQAESTEQLRDLLTKAKRRRV